MRDKEKKLDISVIIITHNEAKNIPSCLRSVDFAEEVIIVDSGSSDRTLEIARALRPDAKIKLHTDWQGFGHQKNIALSYASCEWVLSLDADEWLSDKAIDTIGQILSADNSADGYKFTRRNLFLGRKLRSFNYWPDRVLRLCRREKARFTDDKVHERLVCTGRVKLLDAPIIHNTGENLSEFIEKNIHYLKIQLEQSNIENNKSCILRIFLSPLYRFVRDYAYWLGFLDGILGFVLAFNAAYLTFLKYALLFLKNKSKNKENSV